MNYQKLKSIKKLYFGFQEIATTLGISKASAKVTAFRYVKQGILLRLKRDLYMLRDRWDVIDLHQRYMLANVIQVPSYISLMTALSYYGITTQIQPGFIESIVVKKTKEFQVNEVVFNYTKIKSDLYFGFSRTEDVFIANPQKAFLDAVYLMSFKRYHFLGGVHTIVVGAAQYMLVLERLDPVHIYPVETVGDSLF